MRTKGASRGKTMAFDYDVIVIGSGFGGAISACRLAEQGHKVLILERGRRWEAKDYPREPGDAWLWDSYHPEKRNGWIDLRMFPNMAVAQGAGVGGGSLIYANISINAKRDTFDSGWPSEITYDELRPYYERVGVMLNLAKLPLNQWTERTKLMKEAAEKVGHGDNFELVDMAVSFDEDWNYDLDDPFNERRAKTFTNAEGVEQRTCIHLGNCDIGCDVQAKNTLDLNYIPRAEKHGAEVRPLHVVQAIEQEADGYRVQYQRIEGRRKSPGSVTGRIVVLGAGSLGTTELLLRSRDQYGTLPNVSPFLGHSWSSNGDFVVPTIYKDRAVSPTKGPTISSAIDFLGERNLNGQHFYVEDGGFPDVLGNYLDERAGNRSWRVGKTASLGALRYMLRQRDPMSWVMPWFGQARDAGDGVMSLKKRWWLFGPKRLYLKWDHKQSQAAIEALIDMQKRMSDATGGTAIVPPTWTLFKDLITPHPLGGAGMGTSPSNGVVDHKGEVFGYKNLYVADGAAIPKPIGLNPSKTIGALAERMAKIVGDEGR